MMIAVSQDSTLGVIALGLSSIRDNPEETGEYIIIYYTPEWLVYWDGHEKGIIILQRESNPGHNNSILQEKRKWDPN